LGYVTLHETGELFGGGPAIRAHHICQPSRQLLHARSLRGKLIGRTAEMNHKQGLEILFDKGLNRIPVRG
jgi:hypothetical protein